MIAALMSAFLKNKRYFASALLCVSFVMLLFLQVAEAAHFHESGVSHSECVQCKTDASAALSEPDHVRGLQAVAADLHTLYHSIALNAPYSRHSPRGPPTFS